MKRALLLLVLLACNGSSSPPPPPPPPALASIVPAALRDIASIVVARHQGYGKKPACSPLDSITVTLATLSWSAMTCNRATGERTTSPDKKLAQIELDAIARAVAKLPAEGSVCDTDAGQRIVTVTPATGAARAYGPCFPTSSETKPIADALDALLGPTSRD